MSIALIARFEGLMAELSLPESKVAITRAFFTRLTAGEILMAGYDLETAREILHDPHIEVEYLRIFEASACECGGVHNIAHNTAEQVELPTVFDFDRRQTQLRLKFEVLRGNILGDKELDDELDELEGPGYYGGLAVVHHPREGQLTVCFIEKQLTIVQSMSLLHMAMYNED